MQIDRRAALAAGLIGAGALASAPAARAAAATVPHPGSYPPGRPGADYTPVTTPNGATLPFKVRKGVKVFHLIAEEVEHEFAPGLTGRVWGYNGRCHGPTIEAVEGDRVRIYLTNRLPAPTSIHWHGLILPSGMDGVSGLSQPPVPPGETWVYEFTLVQHGTHMYHSHHDEMIQLAMGLSGLFVIHPRRPVRRVDRDFAMLFSEWRIRPGARRPNPLEMTDFNIFTVNGKAYPGTEAMVARQGQRVRLRLANLSPMSHHSIHLHGHAMTVTATDGGPLPASAQWPEVTVLSPVGATRDVEFVADNPGDWAVHCHMTHHTMNQMGHDLPSMLGVDNRGYEAAARAAAPGFMTMGQTGMSMSAPTPPPRPAPMDHGTMDHGAMDHGVMDHGTMDHSAMGHAPPAAAAPVHSHTMPGPPNSIAMQETPGPNGPIGMGGMFTILKVRPGLADYSDPGWWSAPKGTQAWRATSAELDADGIAV